MTSQQDVSGWAVGWTAFAAVLMIIMGFFHAMAGLVGILEDDLIVLTPDYVFQFSITTWGWIHLIAGIIVLLAGFYLFTGAVWARIIGVIIVVLSMVANFAWLPLPAGLVGDHDRHWWLRDLGTHRPRTRHRRRGLTVRLEARRRFTRPIW